MIDAMNLAILVGAGLVAISIFTSVVSFRVGAPLLLIFLGVGLAAGEDGLGGIDFDNAPAAYFIGSLALAIILFDSGFATSLQTFRTAAWPAVILATFGVLLTAVFLAAAARYLFGLPWLEAMLLGAIVGSTDAAAVFFLLRVGGITIRERVRSTLEVESGSNDPMAIFLTVTLVEAIAGGTSDQDVSWKLAIGFLQQIGLGLVLGAAGGTAIIAAVNRAELEGALYPILVLSLAVCLFAGTSIVGGSGFLAVYVAGLIAGNTRIRGKQSLRRFQGGMAWLSQIVMFLTLGLLATPSHFVDLLFPAVVLAAILMFVARPLATWICLLPFGFTRKETTFVAWVGLRGAVSILLAILPIIGGVDNNQLFFSVSFVIVLVSLVVQGWTIRPTARWLGLIVPSRIGPVDRVELELPGNANHELVVYRIREGSPVARGERIPRWARPSLIIRDGQSMRLHSAGRLRPGDHVYIFIPPERVKLLDKLFARPAAVDADDQEFFGDFSLAPDSRLATLAETYGLGLRPGERTVTVADALRQEFGSGIEVGDRLPYGPVELIVRGLDQRREVNEVGLALEPRRSPRRLPLFRTRRKMMLVLAAWRGRWWRLPVADDLPAGRTSGADPAEAAPEARLQSDQSER